MKIRIIILTLFLATISLLAQEENWQLTLVSGETLSNVSLLNLVGDSLAISQSGQTSWINAESLSEIRKIVESEFWTGAGFGALIGALATAAIAGATYDDSGFNIVGPGGAVAMGAVLGALGGFIVGGTIGSLVGNDEVYDLSPWTLEDKLKLIRMLLNNQEG